MWESAERNAPSPMASEGYILDALYICLVPHGARLLSLIKTTCKGADFIAYRGLKVIKEVGDTKKHLA